MADIFDTVAKGDVFDQVAEPVQQGDVFDQVSAPVPDATGSVRSITSVPLLPEQPPAPTPAPVPGRKFGGFWSELGISLQREGLSAGSAVLAQAARADPGSILRPGLLEEVSESLQEKADVPALQPGTGGGASGFVAQSLGGAIPFSLATAGATLLAGPGAGFATAYTIEGESSRREALADGATDEEADMAMVVGGGIKAVLEVAGVGKLFKTARAGKEAVKAATKVAKVAAKKNILDLGKRATVAGTKLAIYEGVTEGLQETTDVVLPVIRGGELPELKDAAVRVGKAGLGGAIVAPILGGASVATSAAVSAAQGTDARPAPEAVPEVTPAEPTVEEEATPDKPTPDQLHAGHKIPQFIGIKAKKRRRIMKRLVGKDSMADMTQEEAQQVVDEFVEMADKKGEDVTNLLTKPDFKEVAFGRFTPSRHRARVMGVHFLVEPAIIGKMAQTVEAENLTGQVAKMEQVINRMGGETLKSRTAAKVKNQPTASVERFFHLLDQNEAAPDTLTADESKVFNFFRTLNTSLLTRENEVRRELGQKEIPNRKAYVRHVATQAAHDMIDGRRRIPKDVEFLFKERVSKKIYNPMEFERRLTDELLDVFSRDLIKATDAMVWTATKEIHLNKPLRYFEEMMDLHRKDVPPSVRKWTEKYVKETILGHQTETDEKWDKMVAEGGIGKVLNKVLRPFGRTVGSRPLTSFMNSIGKLQVYGVLGPLRPKQLIRNKFQFLQNLMLYKPSSMIKSFAVSNDPNLEAIMEESLFLKTYGGIEDAPLTGRKALEKVWLGAFKWSAVTNAKRAMRVAYFDNLELITDKKFAKYGYADPQRTYTEEKGFLYESEKALLKDEMEFGAGLTQYHYIGLAMPEVFRSKVNTPFTRLQSWWMNYWFGFLREGATRAFTGKTATGRTIPPSRRFGLIRYLAFAGATLNFLGYTSSFLLGTAPGLAPLAGMLLSMFKYAKTDDERRKNMAWREFMSAMKTFMPGYLSFKDFKKAMSEGGELKDLFFYEKGVFADDSGNTGPQLSRRAAE